MRFQSMSRAKVLCILLLVIGLLTGCKKEQLSNLEASPTPFTIAKPAHFPDIPIPADNPTTVEGVALGKRLFYDPILSLDKTVSCNSCHVQLNAFSDPNKFSLGVNGAIGTRNSMPLYNLAWQQFFFWDGRAKSLEQQILEPVPNPKEMHLSWVEAVGRLRNDDLYLKQFKKAFPNEQITDKVVAKAIAQFLRTLVSANSKFDVMYKSKNSYSLNNEEQGVLATVSYDEWEGYKLFYDIGGADCAHCHSGPFVHLQKFSNNGLDLTFADLGRGVITNQEYDNGKFKVPSLRNIEVTGPYMHDGRFVSLEEVITHYSDNVKNSPNIDPNMEFVAQGGVQLNALQKIQLNKFLLTMTDHSFLQNPAHTKP